MTWRVRKVGPRVHLLFYGEQFDSAMIVRDWGAPGLFDMLADQIEIEETQEPLKG